ncbi:MAG: RNA polymerase sigma-70 factor (ECF subfamily) [Myxococcota bacterium]|jgi:RNA polymerase sigma-70 factor (ECF subfamily)
MSASTAISQPTVVFSSRTGLRDLFDRFGPMVYRRCRTLLGNHHDAEEAVQEVFVRAMRSDSKRDDQVSSWLYRIATNYCLNKIRDQRRRDELWDQHGTAASRTTPTPQKLLLVKQVLSAVDERCATAAIYVFVDGMSHGEAAEIMDVSRRTIGNLLDRFAQAAAEFLAEGDDA